MKTSCFLTISFLIVSLNAEAQLKPNLAEEKVVTDEYFGTKLDDPFRYLENLKDPEVINWMKSNAVYARSKLNEISERENILKKLNEFDSRKESTVYNLQITENDSYFYLKRNANEENGKLYYRLGYKGEEKLLFDPEAYKKSNGLNYSISSIIPNELGDKVAFEIAPSGSESAELLIIDNTGKLFPEVYDKCWFSSVSWMPDGNSFTYSQLNSSDITNPNRLLNSKIYFHRLGEDPSKDIEYFSNATNPELNIGSEELPFNFYHKNSNKNYALVITVDKRLKLFSTDFKNNFAPTQWRTLVEKKDEVSNFSVDKEFIYYQTFKNASNYKIIKVPISNPTIEHAIEVIEESKNEIINNFVVTKDGLYYTTTKNGIQAKVYFLAHGKNKATELKLPFEAGSAILSIISENKNEIWITISGWTSPDKRYLYNPANDIFTLQPLSKMVEYPELNNIISKEVMIPSHDGTMVPVSIIHNKSTKRNGNNLVMMMGYGAYGISIEPWFSPSYVLTYCYYGGVFVIPHVRGGGELGDAWHKAGQKTTKPNSWKDFIATAEYLIKEKYTNPNKIAISGGSAGGILIGRAMTERPDLFAAAIPVVGSLNTVRMENSPNGPANIPEFGTVKNETEFKALLEMDSFHHIKKGSNYPATLVTAGMNDPRVIAWQPSKFAAALQNATSSNKPILFYTDFEAGHGLGDSKTKMFEGIADLFTFAFQHTGHPKFQPSKKLKN